MKEIKLFRKSGEKKVALVDDEDFEYLNQFRWYWVKTFGICYAYRRGKNSEGKTLTILMHREILCVSGSKNFVDHKDHNALNNQKSNLRRCNNSQNIRNARKRKGATSKYLGVSWYKGGRGKWRVNISNGDQKFSLGMYHSEEEAAAAYNKKAIELHGEFANLNILPPEFNNASNSIPYT